MLTNIQRLRIYAGLIIVFVFVAGISFNVSAGGKLDDVRLLGQARELSYGLERYKQDYWHFPQGQNIDLRKPVVLSENGFAPGNSVYYRGAMKSSRAVTYDSSGDDYSIAFTLRQAWPEQGILDTKCTITTHYRLDCGK